MGAGKGHVVEVTDYTGSFRANEAVMLEGRNYMGLQAVVLAFVIPLSLIVALIVLGACLGWRESASALAGLSSLFPYYIILYFFRGRLRKRFVFTIKKINS
jgi:sigma-E factor negative regulatory protein RseC